MAGGASMDASSGRIDPLEMSHFLRTNDTLTRMYDVISVGSETHFRTT